MGASIDCKNKVDYAATGDSQEAAHGPEVDGLVVALARDGLRRQVLRGAAHREALELLLVRRGTAPPAAAEEAHAHRALLLLELWDPAAAAAAPRGGNEGDVLAEPEVDELKVARAVEGDVLGLQVTVRHPEGVHVLQRRRDAHEVESGVRRLEAPGGGAWQSIAELGHLRLLFGVSVDTWMI